MSADFVFAVAEIDRTQDDWQSFVTGMDDDTLRRFIAETNGQLYWDEYFGDATDIERQVRERLCEAIGICYGGSNEIGYWRDNGREFVVTGGMSWGDDPTDAMADVYMLGVLRDWRASSCEECQPREWTCDGCLDLVPDGAGYYVNDMRVCEGCAEKVRMGDN